MPIYEYECSACGSHHEVVQKMSDPPLTTCEKCGEAKLEKLISHSAFHLKGGGWYSDLYSSSSGSKDKKPESKSESSTKSETKAASA
ncbi:MAG: zinc ribbon domain-containing protein [Myxococcota bacterium]